MLTVGRKETKSVYSGKVKRTGEYSGAKLCPFCLTKSVHPKLGRGESYLCGYKPYRCEACNYSTTTKGNLAIHQQSDKHLNNIQGQEHGDLAPIKHPSLPESNVIGNGRISNILMENNSFSEDSGTNINKMVPLYTDPTESSLSDLVNIVSALQTREFQNASQNIPLSHVMQPSANAPQFIVTTENADETSSRENLRTRLYETASQPLACQVCCAFTTNDPEILIKHAEQSRIPANPEQTNLMVTAQIAGFWFCRLCAYKSPLKANFQLHCKTEKHAQRLSYLLHANEGDQSRRSLNFLSDYSESTGPLSHILPVNSFATVSMDRPTSSRANNILNGGQGINYSLNHHQSPIQLVCLACDMFTMSVHKYRMHCQCPRHTRASQLFHGLVSCRGLIWNRLASLCMQYIDFMKAICGERENEYLRNCGNNVVLKTHLSNRLVLALIQLAKLLKTFKVQFQCLHTNNCNIDSACSSPPTERYGIFNSVMAALTHWHSVQHQRQLLRVPSEDKPLLMDETDSLANDSLSCLRLITREGFQVNWSIGDLEGSLEDLPLVLSQLSSLTVQKEHSDALSEEDDNIVKCSNDEIHRLPTVGLMLESEPAGLQPKGERSIEETKEYDLTKGASQFGLSQTGFASSTVRNLLKTAHTKEPQASFNVLKKHCQYHNLENITSKYSMPPSTPSRMRPSSCATSSSTYFHDERRAKSQPAPIQVNTNANHLHMMESIHFVENILSPSGPMTGLACIRPHTRDPTAMDKDNDLNGPLSENHQPFQTDSSLPLDELTSCCQICHSNVKSSQLLFHMAVHLIHLSKSYNVGSNESLTPSMAFVKTCELTSTNLVNEVDEFYHEYSCHIVTMSSLRKCFKEVMKSSALLEQRHFGNDCDGILLMAVEVLAQSRQSHSKLYTRVNRIWFFLDKINNDQQSPSSHSCFSCPASVRFILESSLKLHSLSHSDAVHSTTNLNEGLKSDSLLAILNDTITMLSKYLGYHPISTINASPPQAISNEIGGSRTGNSMISLDLIMQGLIRSAEVTTPRTQQNHTSSKNSEDKILDFRQISAPESLQIGNTPHTTSSTIQTLNASVCQPPLSYHQKLCCDNSQQATTDPSQFNEHIATAISDGSLWPKYLPCDSSSDLIGVRFPSQWMDLPGSTPQQRQTTQTIPPRRSRTRLSESQLATLRSYFDINNSPSDEKIAEICLKTGLHNKVVKHWFRNTLFKERQRTKDNPYNFSIPPSTSLNLEEYEKTGRIELRPAFRDLSRHKSIIVTKADEKETSTTMVSHTSVIHGCQYMEVVEEGSLSDKHSTVGARSTTTNHLRNGETPSTTSPTIGYKRLPCDNTAEILPEELNFHPKKRQCASPVVHRRLPSAPIQIGSEDEQIDRHLPTTKADENVDDYLGNSKQNIETYLNNRSNAFLPSPSSNFLTANLTYPSSIQSVKMASDESTFENTLIEKHSIHEPARQQLDSLLCQSIPSIASSNISNQQAQDVHTNLNICPQSLSGLSFDSASSMLQKVNVGTNFGDPSADIHIGLQKNLQDLVQAALGYTAQLSHSSESPADVPLDLSRTGTLSAESSNSNRFGIFGEDNRGDASGNSTKLLASPIRADQRPLEICLGKSVNYFQPSQNPTSSTPGASGTRRNRTSITALQSRCMHAIYQHHKTPSVHECDRLGGMIGLTRRVVQVWFQNQRAKEKKLLRASSLYVGSQVSCTPGVDEIVPTSESPSFTDLSGDHSFCNLCGVSIQPELGDSGHAGRTQAKTNSHGSDIKSDHCEFELSNLIGPNYQTSSGDSNSLITYASFVDHIFSHNHLKKLIAWCSTDTASATGKL